MASHRFGLLSWVRIGECATLLLGFAAVLVVTPVPGADDKPRKPDERVAWQFTIKEETTVIVKRGDGKWQAVRSDGKQVIYAEIERNESQIQLQNIESKLFTRLEADYGYWRRPTDEKWTRWVRGKWLGAGEIPAAARALLEGKGTPDIPPLKVPSPPVTTTKPNPAPAPSAKKHEIRLVYLVPRDRQPTQNYQKKINVLMLAVSEIVRDDLRAKKFDTPGLAVESADGQMVVHLVRGKQDASHYNLAPNYDADQQVRMLMPEVRQALGSPFENLFVIFAETYDYGPAEVLWPGVLAQGAWYGPNGGIAVYSAHLLRDEFCATTVEEQRKFFFDATPILGRATFEHRQPNAPRFEFVEDGFGAVTHELGHALGLPHDRRRDDIDIMGNGFRHLRWNFAPPGRGRRVTFSDDNARLLMASRFLNSAANTTDNTPPKSTFRLLRASNEPPKLEVELSDNIGLRALVYFDLQAGSVVGGRQLTGTSASFRDPIPPNLVRNGRIELELFVIDEGGNIGRTKDSFTY